MEEEECSKRWDVRGPSLRKSLAFCETRREAKVQKGWGEQGVETVIKWDWRGLRESEMIASLDIN